LSRPRERNKSDETIVEAADTAVEDEVLAVAMDVVDTGGRGGRGGRNNAQGDLSNTNRNVNETEMATVPPPCRV